jgi:predicted transcriptional regulator
MKLPDEVINETNELLDELTKELTIEKRQPGDVSSYDLAKTTGLTRERCNHILNEKADKGLLQKVEVRSDTNRPTFVYRKVVK